MKTKNIILSILVNVAAGTAFAGIKYLYEDCHFSMAQITILRLFFPALILAPFYYKTFTRFCRHDMLLICLLATMSMLIPSYLNNLGIQTSSTVNAGLLIVMEPIFIIIMASVILRENLTFVKVAGILMGAFGMILIACQGIPWMTASLQFHTGDIYLIASAILWATYSIIIKFMRNPQESMPLLFWIATIGCVSSLPFAWKDLILITNITWTWSIIATFTYLTTVSWIFVMYYWNKILEEEDSSMFAFYIYLQPVTAIIISFLFLEETISRFHFAGGLIIVLAISLINKKQSKQQSQDTNIPNVQSF